MAKAPTITLRVADMPEMLWDMAHALADLLRKSAEGEPEFVRRKLYEVAGRFEAGIGTGRADGH